MVVLSTQWSQKEIPSSSMQFSMFYEEVIRKIININEMLWHLS